MHTPLSYGGVVALPVAALDRVVVADVLLLVLLHRRSRGHRGQLLSSIKLGGHFIAPGGYSGCTHDPTVSRVTPGITAPPKTTGASGRDLKKDKEVSERHGVIKRSKNNVKRAKMLEMEVKV